VSKSKIPVSGLFIDFFWASLLADRYAKPKYPSVHHLSFSPRDGSYLATGHSSGHTMVDVSSNNIYPLNNFCFPFVAGLARQNETCPKCLSGQSRWAELLY